MRRSQVVAVVPWLTLGAGCVAAIEPEASRERTGAREAVSPVPPRDLPSLETPRADAATSPERQSEDAGAALAPSARPCATPALIGGAPQTIGEAIALMNALPKPTSLACFIESLPRPLHVYLTSSQLSAQPAAGEESPRIFVINEPLFLGFVPEGAAEGLLELGWRTSPNRAIRTEVVFPLRERVRADELIDHIALTDRNSFCGSCHFGERPAYDSFLGDGALESDVNEPSPDLQVDLEWLRERADECDAAALSGRCEVLTAVFAHGEVLDSPAFTRQSR